MHLGKMISVVQFTTGVTSLEKVVRLEQVPNLDMRQLQKRTETYVLVRSLPPSQHSKCQLYSPMSCLIQPRRSIEIRHDIALLLIGPQSSLA